MDFRETIPHSRVGSTEIFIPSRWDIVPTASDNLEDQEVERTKATTLAELDGFTYCLVQNKTTSIEDIKIASAVGKESMGATSKTMFSSEGSSRFWSRSQTIDCVTTGPFPSMLGLRLWRLQ